MSHYQNSLNHDPFQYLTPKHGVLASGTLRAGFMEVTYKRPVDGGERKGGGTVTVLHHNSPTQRKRVLRTVSEKHFFGRRILKNTGQLHILEL